MNDRDRVLTLLGGDTVPDRVPWFGDLAYWAAAMEQWGQVPEGWQATPDYYRFQRELRVGFYLQGYFAYRETYDGDITIEEQSDARGRTRTVRTPVGTLTESWRYLPISCSWSPDVRMVKGVDDLPALRYWYEHTHYQPYPKPAVARRPWVGENGVVLCYLPRTPFMQLMTELAGIETIVELWMSARDAFEETLDAMTRSGDRAVEAALQVPADCFMIPENLSSEVVGKRFYRQYLAPVERRWIERIHEAGCTAFIHMDGTLAGLLREVAETGFDVIEAFTPFPAGDLSIHEVRAVAGPNVVLWGGVPGIYFTDLVDDVEFDRHVVEVLEVMVADRRMVLGVADQVPPNGLRRRVARVAELVEQHGVYPDA